MSEPIGIRVKSAILGAGLTQKQIAAAIGVSQQSVTKWIKDGKICRENMLLLSRVTGYTFNWLSTGSGMQRRHHANTLLAAKRKDLRLATKVEQVVAHLVTHDWKRLEALLHLLHAEIGHAAVLYLSLRLKVYERAHGL